MAAWVRIRPPWPTKSISVISNKRTNIHSISCRTWSDWPGRYPRAPSQTVVNRWIQVGQTHNLGWILQSIPPKSIWARVEASQHPIWITWQWDRLKSSSGSERGARKMGAKHLWAQGIPSRSTAAITRAFHQTTGWAWRPNSFERPSANLKHHWASTRREIRAMAAKTPWGITQNGLSPYRNWICRQQALWEETCDHRTVVASTPTRCLSKLQAAQVSWQPLEGGEAAANSKGPIVISSTFMFIRIKAAAELVSNSSANESKTTSTATPGTWPTPWAPSSRAAPNLRPLSLWLKEAPSRIWAYNRLTTPLTLTKLPEVKISRTKPQWPGQSSCNRLSSYLRNNTSSKAKMALISWPVPPWMDSLRFRSWEASASKMQEIPCKVATP